MIRVLATKRGIIALTCIVTGLALVSVAIVYIVPTFYNPTNSFTDVPYNQKFQNSGLWSNLLKTNDNIPPELVFGYPAARINPQFWDDYNRATSINFESPKIPEDFILIENPEQVNLPIGTATGIKIPIIGIDSEINELSVINIGDSEAYETPAQVVGHIPETGQAGAQQTGWYFGHLESFVRGEGNVFRSLPQIAELIRYDTVDIYVSTDTAEFVYRVKGTFEIHQSDLQAQGLLNNNNYDLYLCTCWPPRNYSYRILVNAQLLAYKVL